MVDRNPRPLIAQVYRKLIRARRRPRIGSYVKDYGAVSTTGDENTGRLCVPVEILVIPDPTIIRNRDVHCTSEVIQADVNRISVPLPQVFPPSRDQE